MSSPAENTSPETLISVIIPCYNARKFIGETLESVFAQADVHLEVLAIDDGSADDTAAFIEHCFPQVKLTRTANQGASAARQLGTTLAQGGFIQYLDADDLLCPGKLSTQLSALRRESADVAYGDFQKFHALADGSLCVSEQVERKLGDDPECDLFFASWSPPAVYLIRRTIVEKVGAWPANLPVIQDARFMVDCASAGARFVRCPGMMARYRESPGSLSRRNHSAFLRDCCLNTAEIMDRWSRAGSLTDQRRRALVAAANHVAWTSVETLPDLFRQACEMVTRLDPGGPPAWPPWTRVASHVLGYRRIALCASRTRKLRRLLKGAGRKEGKEKAG